MKKWEYKLVPFENGRHIDKNDDQKSLDWEGERGWELVAIQDGFFAMKRELQNQRVGDVWDTPG